MRLLLVTNDYPPKPGGIQQYLGNLVDAFEGEVRVLAPADGPAGETARGEAVVRRHRGKFLWPTPGVRRWVVGQAGRFQPDLVLFGAPYPLAWLTPRLKEEVGAPVGILCHGAEVTVPAVIPGVRTLMKRSLRAADHRFAVSRFTADRVSRLSGMPVDFVGSGVDPDTFTSDRAPATDDGVPTVGCVSRFVARKGQGRLLRAAAALHRRGTPVRVLFVGSGRLERRLRKQAERLGVDARFEIGVSWADLPRRYGEMDVFCMPCRSRWGGLEVEGLGIVYIEAAASGLPVLAGDSGGAPETVVPGETGFVVHSVGDIVEGLEMLLNDPERARQMGASGRRFVAAEYTWTNAARRIAGSVAADG